MATKIRGITIEIGGDTSPLAKALKDVNAEVRDTQQQLKDVEKLLKFDPGNTEALRQKQELLNQSVEDHKKKLEAVKAIQDQLNRTLAEGGEVNQKQLNAVNREVEFLTKELENAEKAAKGFDARISKISNSAKDLGDKLTGAGKALAPVSGAAAGVLGGAVALVQSTAEESADFAKLETNAKKAGAGMEYVEEAMRRLYAVTQETDSNIEGLSNLMETGFTDTGLLQAVELLSGAVIKFPDTLKIESLADSLQETLATGKATGQFGELLDRLGIGVDAFNIKLERTSGESARLNLALRTLARAGLGEVTAEYFTTNKALTDTLMSQQDLQSATVEIGDALRPVVAELMPVLVDLLKSVAEFLASMDTQTLKTIAGILAFTAVLSPMLLALGGLSSAIGGAVLWLPKLGGALGAVKGIASGVGTALSGVGSFLLSWPGIILAVVATIAIAGDDIQAALSKLDDFLKGVFEKDWTEVFGSAGEVVNGFFANIQNLWDSIKKVLDGVIDFIRGVFTGDWERAWRGVSEIFEGVFEGLAAIAAAPINMVIGVINWLIDGLNTFFKWLNSIKLPDFLGGGNLFNLGEVGKIGYIDTSNLADSLFGAKKASAGVGRVLNTSARERAAARAQELEERRAAASQRAKLTEGQSMTINNYNSINADNLAQVARMEQMLNGQRQSIRAGYAGG